MLLVVDLGNTHTTLGLFEGDRLQARQTISSQPAAFETLSETLSGFPIQGVALASVFPAMQEPIRKALEPFGEIRQVEQAVPGLVVSAEGAGADRLMNALAASQLGNPVLVLDLGTATTFELVQDGEFLGGAILPGWGLFAETLPQRTHLPPVALDFPPTVLGRNTREALRAGLTYGYRDLLQGLVRRYGELCGELTVVATGGLCPLVQDWLRIEPDLTLHGLRLFWERTHA